MTLTIELQNEDESSAEGAAALVASGSGGSAGQSLLGQSREPEEFGDTGDTVASTGADARNSWARFVGGLDQAIEKIRTEADERLRQEQQPAKPEQPGTTLLQDENEGARQTGAAAFLEHAESEARRRLETVRDRLLATDVAIGSWTQFGPAASNSRVPVIAGARPTNTGRPLRELLTDWVTRSGSRLLSMNVPKTPSSGLRQYPRSSSFPEPRPSQDNFCCDVPGSHVAAGTL